MRGAERTLEPIWQGIQSLRADWSGIVQAVPVTPEQQVLGGDALIELE